MIRRVLIANRGEIAVRIIRACQELGIETVAVHSDIDRDALHVRLADSAWEIGPADAAQSYLNGPAILAAAQAAGADAIHPGYGFLSEDAAFAALVEKSGIIFIGPNSYTIALVGNKDNARSAMQKANLPMSEASEPLTDSDEAVRQAERIGYPVIVKPISGGGGRGMHIAHNPAELQKALRQAKLNKLSVYVEKYIAEARHIEVQIVADQYGHIIHLGERECSLQRRNQKLLEEAPSAALTPEARQKVGELAVRAAKSIHYTSVGTVEFLMDDMGQFYFIEINPRIQVEHGITEMITGIDLVKTQIQIAAGQPLSMCQEDVTFQGHAIECRINAEDPAKGFMPSPGLITFYHQPGGPNVRVDSGVCAGCTVQPYYDSLIAKVIVKGQTRGEAIRIMQRALAEFHVAGVATTVGFHRQVLENPHFRCGDIDTQFVNRRMIS